MSCQASTHLFHHAGLLTYFYRDSAMQYTFAYPAAPLHRIPCPRNVNRRPHLQFRHPISSSSFAILRRGGIVAPPCSFALSLKKKTCKNDEWNVLDVQNPTESDYTTLGHILTIPMQVKQKIVAFSLHQRSFCK